MAEQTATANREAQELYEKRARVTREVVRAEILSMIKPEKYGQITDHAVGMRTALSVQKQLDAEIRAQQEALRQAVRQYERTKSEKDFEAMKKANAELEKLLHARKYAQEQYNYHLRGVQKQFDQEHEAIEAKLNSSMLPHPLRLLLGLFYHAGHMLKQTAFHLGMAVHSFGKKQPQYTYQIQHALDTQNPREMISTGESMLKDDSIVRSATQNQKQLLSDEEKAKIQELIENLKQLHAKLENLLGTHVDNLKQAEQLINNKIQEAQSVPEKQKAEQEQAVEQTVTATAKV